MPRVVWPEDLIARMPLGDALDRELKSGPTLLPPRAQASAAEGHRDEYLALIKSRLAAGLDVTEPEVIHAKKATRGVRPVPLLPLLLSVVYRALGLLLATYVEAPARSAAVGRTFREAPLRSTSSKFVVMADISACYQYLDHELIYHEIVHRSGDAQLASAVRDILAGSAGRTFGIPQNYSPSHAIADLVLDIIERRMLRRGYSVWRFNDDFRIGTDSWRAASGALEDLEREAEAVGLTLNDEKSAIRARKRYQELLRGAEKRWKEIQSSVAGTLLQYDPYTDEAGVPTDAEVAVQAAVEVLESWQADVQEGREHFGQEGVQNRQLIQNAVYSLQVFKSDEGLRFVKLLLDREAAMTPFIARYLTAQASADPGAVEALVDACIRDADTGLSEWQAIWLFEAVAELRSISDVQREFATALMRADRSSFVAARAAFALAVFDAVDELEIAQIYTAQHEASKPDAVAALALRTRPRKQTQLLKSMADDAPEFGWVIEAWL